MNPSAKELALQWFEVAWNQKDRARMATLLEPSLSGDTEGGPITSAEQFINEMYRPFVEAMPDARVAVDGAVGEGNEAVVRWTITGTHTGELPGVPASGRKISFSGMTWLRFNEAGRIYEGWDRYNLGGLVAALTAGCESATCRVL